MTNYDLLVADLCKGISEARIDSMFDYVAGYVCFVQRDLEEMTTTEFEKLKTEVKGRFGNE
ncbi:MAG: hypothetical protein OXI24_19225 [Candidatus Poribacteria bacterium]|nr:hypothetical protein [Candidatus Poribacteria bacterium]